MAQFTKLDEASMQALVEQYPIGALEGWQPIAAGTVNSNFWLEAGGRRYFLRVNEGKSDTEVRAEFELVQDLRSAGVETPSILATAEGEAFARHGERQVSLFEWLEGSQVDSNTIEPEHCEGLGRALASLHRVGATVGADSIGVGMYTLEHILDRLAGIDLVANPELEATVRDLDAELHWALARRRELGTGPGGVVHQDLFPDNAIFRVGAPMVVLDWEQACRGSFAYDLAVCANAWCFGAELEPARFEALRRGYRDSGGEWPDPERLQVELRAAAARFTVTRITDVYLLNPEHPGKDYRRFLMRLHRWRADLAMG